MLGTCTPPMVRNPLASPARAPCRRLNWGKPALAPLISRNHSAKPPHAPLHRLIHEPPVQPICRAFSMETSAIMASTRTCERIMSSLAMTSSSSLNSWERR